MRVVKPEENLSLSEYIYSLRFYILFVSILFIGSIILGYVGFFGGTFSRPMGRLQQLSEVVEDFTVHPVGLFFLAFVLILLNNALTCFLNIVLGPLLAIAPLASAVFNGGLIGCLAQKEGLIIFVGILPHGIFEIPALLLSAAIGLRMGREILKNRMMRDLKG
ncbi:MAG: stage II sporulation protein M, partial [Methanophagales archaeon]|nr:stage II sporulation protein M [Methanophagales archaeon]